MGQIRELMGKFNDKCEIKIIMAKLSLIDVW